VATNAWAYANSTNLTTPKTETLSRTGEAWPYVWTSGHALSSSRASMPPPLSGLALPCYHGNDHNNQMGYFTVESATPSIIWTYSKCPWTVLYRELFTLYYSMKINCLLTVHLTKQRLVCLYKKYTVNVCSPKNNTRIYAKMTFYSRTHTNL